MKSIANIQYITQAQTAKDILLEVKEVLDAGIDWVQLRIKNEELYFLNIALEIKKLTLEYGATFILNDKVALVNVVEADGVHVGLSDMPILEVRNIIGSNKIIGGTANTLVDAMKIEQLGADYIGLGPYTYTKTKKVLSPVLGLEGYQEIVPQIKLPIVAIGGLEIEDIKLLKQNTPIHGVALSGLIYRSENKKEVLNELKNVLK